MSGVGVTAASAVATSGGSSDPSLLAFDGWSTHTLNCEILSR